MGIIIKFPTAAQPRFSPGLGVRVRIRVRAKGWVGSTPVPLSDQEVLSARKREQPTAPKIRATNLLGELIEVQPFFFFFFQPWWWGLRSKVSPFDSPTVSPVPHP